MELVERALRGEHPAGARIIRRLEERDPEGIEALRALFPHTGRAYLLGLTGPPGAGKSTLVDRIVAELRSRDLRVGVVAIDPTSPFSGGAILGDRVRMNEHAADPGVFVRSMATRGHLGGLSRATFETVLVLDAMGHDVVLVETVGVGQDEVEIVDLAHTTLVVSLPGTGDDIQAMKAGILEIGDLFVVNKADLPGADQVVRLLRMMLDLRSREEGAWEPRIQTTVALRDEGLRELVDACFEHRAHLEGSGGLAAKAARLNERLVRSIVRERAEELVFGGDGDEPGEGAGPPDPALAQAMREVDERRLDPHAAADRLLARLRGEGSSGA